MTNAQNHIFLAALRWTVDIGADEALAERPVDRTALVLPFSPPVAVPVHPVSATTPEMPASSAPSIPGLADLVAESTRLAASCETLESLKAAIAGFEGITLKKTATQMVFADGNPAARVMLVGEAPGADEDRQGLPFVGVSGQLLDKILACIDLSRMAEDPAKAVYISNILNWRPPGNRTPSDSEVAISLPFIRRHIELVKPKCLILCGGVSAKALLGSGDSISRLRGKFHDVMGIPAIATYHPSYLLRTPAQKRAVWADMLMLKEKMRADA